VTWAVMATEPTRRAALLAGVARNEGLRFAAVAVLLGLALGALLAIDVLPASLPGAGSAISGGVALVDVRAPRAATYVSQAETELRREQRRNQVPPQYDFSAARAQVVAQRQALAFERAVQPVDAAFSAPMTDAERQQALYNALPTLSAASRATLAGLDRTAWQRLRAQLLATLQSVEEQEVRDTLIDDVRAGLAERIDAGLPDNQRALGAEIIGPLVVPNSTYDADATETARQVAAESVEPVEIQIVAGEVIARAGPLDPLSREKLQLFGLLDPRPDLTRGAAWLMLGIFTAVLLVAWLWRFRPRVWHRGTTLALIGLLMLGAILALKLTAERSVLPYVVPTAAVGLLLAVLLDAGLAVVVMALLALVGGAVVGTVEFPAYVFFGALAGIIVVRRGERLGHFLQAGLLMAVANLAVVSLFSLLGARDLTGLVQLYGASLAAALGAAVAAVGTFVLLGNAFGITTNFQLLELANPTQPLLRRLLFEAPGTYHHSLMVGNLAERAAEAIGADPLLTRVAAYYHDIGKLANPIAYIENQEGGENIHDELPPDESAALLKEHVSSGIDIAYEYGLPKSLIPFIPQHHGTALMSYFLAKAKERAKERGEGKVDERRFRHAGPKPQTREAAILMLADSVEASVRSLTSHDEPQIRAMVARIIRERLEDGQFDECELTLRDIEQVREAFVAQLLGMYHRRVEYPQNKIVEIESRRAAGRGA
jgi:putative nucleotidyltransferase with HDIG domain